MSLGFILVLLLPLGIQATLPTGRLPSQESRYVHLRKQIRLNPVIKLSTSTEFHRYLVLPEREYSAFVLFAERRRNCHQCLEIMRNFKAIAQHYYAIPQEPRVFFFMVIEQELHELFEKFQIDKPPALFHIPAGNGKLVNVSSMDEPRGRLVRVHETVIWMQAQHDMGFGMTRTDEAGRKGSSIVEIILVIFIGINALFFLGRERILKFVNTSEYMAHLGMAVAVLLVSGHVFNYVKSPAFSHGSAFFYPARRYQFQIEAYIMSIIYMGTAVGFLYIIEGRRRKLGRQSNGHRLCCIGTIIFSLSYWAWNQAAQAKS